MSPGISQLDTLQGLASDFMHVGVQLGPLAWKLSPSNLQRWSTSIALQQWCDLLEWCNHDGALAVAMVAISTSNLGGSVKTDNRLRIGCIVAIVQCCIASAEMNPCVPNPLFLPEADIYTLLRLMYACTILSSAPGASLEPQETLDMASEVLKMHSRV